MTYQVNIADGKTFFAEELFHSIAFVEGFRAVTPNEINQPVILQRGVVPPVPVFGCAKGRFRMAADFDAPLEDFKPYM